MKEISFLSEADAEGENDLHHHPRVLSTSWARLAHKFLHLSVQPDANGRETATVFAV